MYDRATMPFCVSFVTHHCPFNARTPLIFCAKFPAHPIIFIAICEVECSAGQLYSERDAGHGTLVQGTVKRRCNTLNDRQRGALRCDTESMNGPAKNRKECYSKRLILSKRFFTKLQLSQNSIS